MFKTEYPFARILLPMIMGIVLFYFYSNPYSLTVLKVFVSFCCLFLLFVNLYYKNLNAQRFKGFVGISIFTFFFMLGGLLCVLNNDRLDEHYFGDKKFSHLKILVQDEPEQSNQILRFKATVTGGYTSFKQQRATGQLLVAIKLDSLHPIKLQYGDELIIAGKHVEIEPPYNPSEFNFKGWLASQNIYNQAFINQIQVIKTQRNKGNPILAFALKLREKQISKYRNLIKNDEAFAVASTLILGYRANLSQETLAAYSKTGTIHALSVSGSHVAILFLVLDFFLGFLEKKKSLKVLKFIVICTLIWAYATITGLSPSVIRSAIMISIFIASKTFAQNKNSYNILAFAAFCQLLYNPFLIWDVGFQLSYISVFGLIYLQPKIYKWIFVKNNWLDKVWQLIALSLSAQVVTFPLSIYYFHQFPVYFLLGNLFIAIPLFIIMLLGIAILVPVLDHLAPIFEWIVVITNYILKRIADLPYSTFSALWINLPELLLLSLSLGLFVYSMSKFNKKALFAALTLFIIYQSLVIYNGFSASQQRKIIFFSLRKHYACAFICAHTAILATDLTADHKSYQYFVKPALDEMQIKTIDFIDLRRDTAIKGLIKKDHQIIFDRYKMLLIDESLNGKKIKLSGSFSSLWLHNNTKYKLEHSPTGLCYSSLIIDASNKDYKISQFKSFADNNKKGVHILKKNKAYLIDLSE
ncbi:hypothetical protein DHW03_03740 [Pedobacter yonginense]|uniref:Competence protein ComEC n=1 Tax=Pedobacter yonginense TaxID=651869 RepID=A0A317EUW0_9SPHI|nr:ComEC/Rec2 family competence protein [Pedobacter yonginense]PWS28958.1 hypothetical protein DHW03_03740 [Pedobacter yonginense]